MDPGLYYPEEMGRPEVARIRAHYSTLDTRALHDASRDRFTQTGGSFYHGDTWAPTFYRLLSWAGLSADDVFYDLGCGCGEPTLTASLFTPRAQGLDLLPGLVRIAAASAQNLELAASFEVGDMLGADLSSATFIYVAATTFDRWHRQQLVRRLKPLAQARFLVQGPPLEGLAVVAEAKEWVFWGEPTPCRFSLQTG